MRRRRGALGIASLVLASAAGLACAPRPRSIELPADASARAQLVAIARDGQSLQLRAADYGAPLRVDLGDDGRADLELLLYDATLAALELEAGPIAPAFDTPLTRPLPEPRAVYRLTIGDDERWSRASGPSDELSALRLPRARRCGLPTVLSHVQLGDVGRTAWMAKAGDDAVEVLSADGALRTVTARGVVTSTRVLTTTTASSGDESFSPLHSARADDGGLWVATRRSVWRVSPRPTPRATWLQKDPRWASLQAIAIDPANPDDETYVAESTGVVDRLSRGTLTRLFDAQTTAVSNIVSLVRWGHGEITVAFSGLAELVHVQGDRVITDYPFDPPEPTTFARRSGDRTLLVIAPSGRVREGTLGADGRFTWREFGRAPIALGWNALTPTPTGFLYGAENGWVGEWRDGEFCDPPTGPLYVDRVTSIVTLDGLVAISGIGAGPRSNEIAFVRWP